MTLFRLFYFVYKMLIILFFCLAAAVLCFDVRLGALTAATDSAHQKMIDSIYAVKLSSHKLQSQMFPWHRWLATPGLRKLVASEEYCQKFVSTGRGRRGKRQKFRYKASGGEVANRPIIPYMIG